MRVVIVDDNMTNCSLLAMLVQREGSHDVTVFTDASAALAHMLTVPFDIALIDYMMPEVDGISLLRQLRDTVQARTVPILIVTTFTETNVRLEALQAGATDFLAKPVNAIEFRARFRNITALRQSQIDLERHAEFLSGKVEEATRDILRREEEVILRLSRATEFRDGDTGSHILRVAAVSREIAEELGCPDEFCRNLYLSSPMHDVGKVAIPDSVLLKAGPLTPTEWSQMKTHANIGYHILKGSESDLVQLAAEIALNHHENWDGSGYPHGLKGENIPLSGRIVAVADVFDALTCERPYKRAWTVESALQEIQRNRAQKFDPAVVDAFFRRLDRILRIRDELTDASLPLFDAEEKQPNTALGHTG